MIPRLSGLATALRMRRHTPEFLHQVHQQHGDLVELSLPGLQGFLVFHPQDVATVLRKGERQHRALLRSLLGGGLFVTPSGSLWRERRTLMQPSFQPARLDGLCVLMQEALDELLPARWGQHARQLDLAREMREITLLVTLRATLGARAVAYPDEALAALDFVLDYLDYRLFALLKLPESLPTPAQRTYRRQMALLRVRVREAVEQQSPGDHLLRWFQSDDPDKTLQSEDLVQEALSIFVAGTETSGTLLTWCVTLLSRHPELYQRLVDELDAACRGGPPSLGALRQVPLLRAVIEEALRLYPPAWAMVRRLPEGAELGAGTLPPGALAWVSPYATHRDPRFWPDPERFDPLRFLPGREPAPRYAWFPFGGGAHHCIGHHFAVLEAELALACVLTRYTLQVHEHPRSRTRPWIALAPQPAPRLDTRLRRARSPVSLEVPCSSP
jgi:cytochrome P450